MSAQHTPGPWGVVANPLRVVSERGDHICGDMEWNDDYHANARLIAAAPELLESLQNAVGWLNYGTDSERHAVDMARAAIAKATGSNT